MRGDANLIGTGVFHIEHWSVIFHNRTNIASSAIWSRYSKSPMHDQDSKIKDDIYHARTTHLE